MSKACKWITFAALLMVALFVLVLFSEQMSATSKNIEVVYATERSDAFYALLEAARRGDYGNNLLRAMDSDDPADYAFITYTVDLQGACPLPAEWATLGLTPVPGDVLMLPGDPESVAPFGRTTLTGTLLTSAQAAAEPRTVWVEYYVLGRALTAPVRAA